MKQTSKVGREAPKYLLRLTAEMREELQREANLNGRSVNSEILTRLQRTLDKQNELRQKGYKAAQSTPNELRIDNDTERAMLQIFRRFSPEKQLALLSLFK